MEYNIVMLTRNQVAYEVDTFTLVTESTQKTNGGGERNLIMWAHKAQKLGYLNLFIHLPHNIPDRVLSRLTRAIQDADLDISVILKKRLVLINIKSSIA